ncbi:GDSL-type esterase/lipase family protein [Paenibacillus sp. OV219]|uniref:GDSL-type esterase/lipase family protein n=1 Tax=Paenibacillus sp. OV219 TaxID=1884377 RepID=UPI0008D3F0F4|nr:GDSL-type esterase/lipase family protein [Paenibacillus sp. OV219]SEM78094.1 Lysophospholipase L1 [Paenibacillus sp. OV219]
MTRSTSNVLWRSIGISALVSTVVLLAGFGYAVKDMIAPVASTYEGDQAAEPAPSKQSSLSQSKQITVAAIGDSLTKGTGDSTGQGYVKQVVGLLKAKYPSIPVKLGNNLALNGLRADQLAHLLNTDKGYRYALQQANLIIFTIGGNDLFQIASGQSSNQATGDISLDHVKAELPKGIERFTKVVGLLHDINPNAQVVYAGLYNPFFDLQELRDGSLQVQKWNEEAYAIMHQYPNMTMVPTFDLFERTIGTYLSNDHFHPNHDGYGQIAERIVQSLE